MTYRAAVLSAVFLACMGITIPAYSGVSKIQIVKGTCRSDSNIVEGSDPTKRLYCDAVTITSFDDYPGHVSIQFSQKEAQTLGFDGRISRQPGDVGTVIQVANVYLGSNGKMAVNDGWCKFLFKDHQPAAIGCIIKVNKPVWAATAAFEIAPGETFQININPDGSIGNPAPGNPTPNAAGEVCQKVQGTDPEIYVMTNVGFSQDGTVVMYVVENLPESDIVDAPQSVEYDIWGNCAARQYTVIDSYFFSKKNRGGYPVGDTGAENVERKVIPGSSLEKAFDMLCNIAREKK